MTVLAMTAVRCIMSACTGVYLVPTACLAVQLRHKMPVIHVAGVCLNIVSSAA